MRRPFVLLLPSVAFGSLVLGGACGGNQGAASDAGTDTYGVHVGDGGGGNGDATSDAPGVTTSLRLAHAAVTVGGVDYCWRAAGAASFVGPVLNGGVKPIVDAGAPGEAGAEGGNGGDAGPDGGAGTDAAASDGGAPADSGLADTGADGEAGAIDAAPAADGGTPNALVFGQMTPGLTLASSGTFDLALVPAGQTSCVAPLLTGQVTLDAGKSATVVLMGAAPAAAGAAPLTLVAYTDEARDPQSAKVRLIHAALGTAADPAAPALAVRAGGTLLADDVEPGLASKAEPTPAVDAQGYTTLAALAPPTMMTLTSTGDAAAATWSTAKSDLGFGAGSLHTGIIVSLGQESLGVVWCSAAVESDAAPPCTLLPAPH